MSISAPERILTGTIAYRSERTPTYNTWMGMHNRCRYPSQRAYRWYGALGIEVCARWHDYRRFLADMGERPAGMTLDRIDPTRGYEPANCRWVTKAVQAAGQRTPGTVTACCVPNGHPARG